VRWFAGDEVEHAMPTKQEFHRINNVLLQVILTLDIMVCPSVTCNKVCFALGHS
jgi:hypothetical protein